MVSIKYLGHSAFQLLGSRGTVLIDPFLSGNAKAAVAPNEVEADLILVSHAHGDHFGDAIDIAKRTGAPILGTFELAAYAASKGVKSLDGHIGGTIKTQFCSVKLFNAVHSSSVSGGLLSAPSSFVVDMDSAKIYHAGDTALFGDMSLIGDEYDLDVAMVPIGGHYTMDAYDAVRAEALLHARFVIPMHYNTHDLILADPWEFAKKISEQGIGECIVLDPGASFDVPSPGEPVRRRQPKPKPQVLKA